MAQVWKKYESCTSQAECLLPMEILQVSVNQQFEENGDTQRQLPLFEFRLSWFEEN